MSIENEQKRSKALLTIDDSLKKLKNLAVLDKKIKVMDFKQK
jgi:hypothetical protein